MTATDSSAALPRRARWSRIEWLVLVLCVALGVLNLWNPFAYATMARK